MERSHCQDFHLQSVDLPAVEAYSVVVDVVDGYAGEVLVGGVLMTVELSLEVRQGEG